MDKETGLGKYQRCLAQLTELLNSDVFDGREAIADVFWIRVFLRNVALVATASREGRGGTFLHDEVKLSVFRALLSLIVPNPVHFDELFLDRNAGAEPSGFFSTSVVEMETNFEKSKFTASFTYLPPMYSEYGEAKTNFSTLVDTNNPLLGGEEFDWFEYDLVFLRSPLPAHELLSQKLWANSSKYFDTDGVFAWAQDLVGQPGWNFWGRWYLGLLNGQPLDWVLQRSIALISDSVWQSGPEAVAQEIARIEAEWLAEQLPQADVLSFDKDAGRFRSDPIPLQAEKLVESVLKQVEFALEVASSSNCGINASSTACLYIDQTLEHCRDDPNAIEQNFEIARQDIVDGVKNGTYFEDSKLVALERALERAVTDLRANHPEVAQAWETRVSYKLNLANADQKQLIVEKTTELISVTSEKLGREMTLDAKTIASTEGEVQAGVLRRFFGRVAQMRVIVRAGEVIQKIDASSGYKGTRIVHTLQSLLSLIFH